MLDWPQSRAVCVQPTEPEPSLSTSPYFGNHSRIHRSLAGCADVREDGSPPGQVRNTEDVFALLIVLTLGIVVTKVQDAIDARVAGWRTN